MYGNASFHINCLLDPQRLKYATINEALVNNIISAVDKITVLQDRSHFSRLTGAVFSYNISAHNIVRRIIDPHASHLDNIAKNHVCRENVSVNKSRTQTTRYLNSIPTSTIFNITKVVRC